MKFGPNVMWLIQIFHPKKKKNIITAILRVIFESRHNNITSPVQLLVEESEEAQNDNGFLTFPN